MVEPPTFKDWCDGPESFLNCRLILIKCVRVEDIIIFIFLIYEEQICVIKPDQIVAYSK